MNFEERYSTKGPPI